MLKTLISICLKTCACGWLYPRFVLKLSLRCLGAYRNNIISIQCVLYFAQSQGACPYGYDIHAVQPNGDCYGCCEVHLTMSLALLIIANPNMWLSSRHQLFISPVIEPPFVQGPLPLFKALSLSLILVTCPLPFFCWPYVELFPIHHTPINCWT
jgi:hypothetical protein